METPRTEVEHVAETDLEKLIVAELTDDEVEAVFDSIVARIDAEQQP